MKDGNTSPKVNCVVFTVQGQHFMQLDQEQSNPSKTVYSCPCGESEVEFEDAGTGA